MEFDKKHGYLIQWCIGMGDLLVINLLFFAVYNGLGEFYTKMISSSLREVVLLLNFCYFFSLYFIPMQLHVAVIFIDKIVQRAFALVSIMVFFICNLPYISQYRRGVGYILAGLLCRDGCHFFSLACFSSSNFKDVSEKGT